MRGTGRGQVRPDRRQVRRALGIALLGLLVGSIGCQWNGERPAASSEAYPAKAAVTGELYLPCTEVDASSGVPAQETRGSTASLSPDPTPEDEQHDTVLAGEISVRRAGAEGIDASAPSIESLASDESRVVQASTRGKVDVTRTTRRDAPQEDRIASSPSANGFVKASQVKPEGAGGPGAGGDNPYQVDLRLPSPLEGMLTPVIPTPERSRSLTLPAAFALAGVENPVIGLAEMAVRQSLAQQLEARSLLLPNVNAGGSYHLHNGPLQSSFGAIRKVDLSSINFGLGAGAVVAGSQTIPGLFINTPIGDAIYAPLFASQIVANRRFNLAATRNQILLDVATAYLNLLQSEARLAVIRLSAKDFNEVVRLTTAYAKPGAGLGRQADADRARADALAVQLDERRAQEQVAVAAADLAHLLNLDPSVRLQTGEVPVQVLQFVDPAVPLPKLLEIAARNRPELMAAAANIRATQVRLRQERTRPLFPRLIAGFSADQFGGGAVASTTGNVFNPHTGNLFGAPSPSTGGRTVPSFGRLGGRTDIDVLAVWTLQNMGFGNVAHVREQRANLAAAEAERVRVLNQVEREVSEAFNDSAARFRSVDIEQRRVREATDGFQLDLNRIRLGRGLPIEVLDNANRLYRARLRLLEAVVGFDRAQFQLFVALGQPPTLIFPDTPPPPT